MSQQAVSAYHVALHHQHIQRLRCEQWRLEEKCHSRRFLSRSGGTYISVQYV